MLHNPPIHLLNRATPYKKNYMKYHADMNDYLTLWGLGILSVIGTEHFLVSSSYTLKYKPVLLVVMKTKYPHYSPKFKSS